MSIDEIDTKDSNGNFTSLAKSENQVFIWDKELYIWDGELNRLIPLENKQLKSSVDSVGYKLLLEQGSYSSGFVNSATRIRTQILDGRVDIEINEDYLFTGIWDLNKGKGWGYQYKRFIAPYSSRWLLVIGKKDNVEFTPDENIIKHYYSPLQIENNEYFNSLSSVVSDEYRIPNYEMNFGAIIDTGYNNVGNHESYYCFTTPIKVKKGERVEITCAAGDPSVVAIAEVDENGTFVRVIQYHRGGQYIFTAEKDCYISICPALGYTTPMKVRIKQRDTSITLTESYFEYGSIGEDGYNTSAYSDWRFFKHRRTKKYHTSRSLIISNTNEKASLVLYEYDSSFALLRTRNIGNTDQTIILSSDAAYWRIDMTSITTDTYMSLEWEQGSLDTDGSEVTNTQVIRSKSIPISSLVGCEFWSKAMMFGRVYDADGNFVRVLYQKNPPYANYRGFIENCLTTEELKQNLYVRLLLRKGYSDNFTPSEVFDWFRPTISQAADVPLPTIKCDDGEVFLPYKKETEEFLYTLSLGTGDGIADAAEAENAGVQYDNKLYFNSGKIMLPSTYSPYGKPVKVVIVCASSNDYQLFSGENLSTSYIDYFRYMVKEGYAVAGFYATTSKYLAGNDGNGSPSTITAMEKGWEYLCQHYNIDKSGCYVIGKSLGGLMGMASLYSAIPIKAANFFAPMLNPNDRQLGYGFPGKRMYCEDCGFTDWDALKDSKASGDSGTLDKDVYMPILRNNINKWAGYNGYWNGIVNKTMAEICDTETYNYKWVKGVYLDVIKICPVPLQIHMAEDDVNVSYKAAYNIVQAINNGGGKARMRTMPNGTGGHYLETDENALYVDSITTALGYICNKVPLVYVEAVAWFRQN